MTSHTLTAVYQTDIPILVEGNLMDFDEVTEEILVQRDKDMTGGQSVTRDIPVVCDDSREPLIQQLRDRRRGWRYEPLLPIAIAAGVILSTIAVLVVLWMFGMSIGVIQF